MIPEVLALQQTWDFYIDNLIPTSRGTGLYFIWRFRDQSISCFEINASKKLL